MDTALPQKIPFILDRNLAKDNYTENQVCMSCDTELLALSVINQWAYHIFEGIRAFLCVFNLYLREFSRLVVIISVGSVQISPNFSVCVRPLSAQPVRPILLSIPRKESPVRGRNLRGKTKRELGLPI